MGAEGYCVNIPWSRGGVGDNDYIFAFQHIVIPIGDLQTQLYFFVPLFVMTKHEMRKATRKPIIVE